MSVPSVWLFHRPTANEFAHATRCERAIIRKTTSAIRPLTHGYDEGDSSHSHQIGNLNHREVALYWLCPRSRQKKPPIREALQSFPSDHNDRQR